MTKEKEETTTMEEIVDSVSKQEKITEQELSNLQSTIRTIDRLTADVGRIETQKYALLVAMQDVQKQVDKFRTNFMEKYGTDNINIQDGTIAYPEENPTPQENGEADKED